MPRFTFIKHSSSFNDPRVEMTMETEFLEEFQQSLQDFTYASGFMPIVEDEGDDKFERRLTRYDFVAQESDYLWAD